ncbi:unnamed protein product [Bursaphelenchus okinawaensis]|uniref:Uncharacterized protein n=1 Tax=Bursaphelenchus okinawaensis TaxID=465554 RepID=A0A811KZ35_9BILA|nr:unnamed protein product [Bursaphelenchus okinawaensis]CAG9114905.1 unnamed protein product [Bursaphelenchus okinawaensis]
MVDRILEKFHNLYSGYSAYHELSLDSCNDESSSSRQETRALQENQQLYAHYVQRLARLQERIQKIMNI